MQGLFSQVIREIQGGLNRLEQAVATQQAQPEQAPNPDAGFQPQTPPSQAPYTPPAPAPQPATPWHGARWEYKVVYVNFRGQISSEGQQATIERGARRSSFVRQYLDELGSQGWELSGVSPLGPTENSYFIFKRPATGEPKPQAQATNSANKVQVEEIDDSVML